MTRRDKFLNRILRGTSDANIPFNELRQLLRRLGFDERTRGNHHIFTEVQKMIRYEVIIYWSEEDQA